MRCDLPTPIEPANKTDRPVSSASAIRACSRCRPATCSIGCTLPTVSKLSAIDARHWISRAPSTEETVVTIADPTAETTGPNPISRWFWTRPDAEIDADLAELRAAGPVFLPEEPVPEEIPLPQGPGGWVITKHDQIIEMSRTPEDFCSGKGITLLDAPPAFNEFFSSMIALDDPRHARLRKLVSAGFTPRMLKRLEDSVQDVAGAIVDDVCERGEVDFVVDVAAKLPLKIVCDLMGIPDSELDFVFEQTNVILGGGDPEYVSDLGDLMTAGLTAGGNLAQLMNEVAATKAGGAGEDLTSVLVNAEVDGEKLTEGELASFFILLVVAGNETTRNAIAWGLHYLTENPEQRRIWQDDFEAVAPTAIEEIVRLASPVTYMRRTATRDLHFHGVDVAEGDKLAMFYLAANRDEDVFDDPHTFDVLRDPNPHIGFGGPGPHFCLGAHLARREITVMFRELFDRLPDIEATGEPHRLLSSFIHGVKHLPASFTPVAPRS
ncbi:MAG: cytochrome P450 [Acidimicrobiales bacterium]|nr:cytochrome P450 [Acidimicrobiales bacterium]